MVKIAKAVKEVLPGINEILPRGVSVKILKDDTLYITASTLTTLYVFLPMIIWNKYLGMIGEMFSDMMFTIVISLIISYLTAVAYGLSAKEVATAINGLIVGSTPTTYWDNTDELKVIVQLAQEDRQGLPDLDSIYIPTNTGQKITLSNLATYTHSVGPMDINRENGTRTVHVTAHLAVGVGVNKIEPKIQALLDEKLILPEGVVYEFTGDQMDIKSMKPTLITVFVVAILMIFAVMASQFESLADPFIIFFSIPLLLIGVVGIYFVSGAVFSLFSFIGIVVLMGIVVNNGIVMVDYINLLRKKGYGLKEAVMEGAVSRLRPVLMTSLTTVPLNQYRRQLHEKT